MAWTTAAQISTGLAFLSFLAALGLTAYRSKLKSQLDQFKSLPASDRANASRAVLNSFGIDASKLSREQQFLLAMKELESRDDRFKYTLLAAVAAVVVSVIVAAYSFGSEPARRTDATPITSNSTPKGEVKYLACRHPDFGQESWRNSHDYSDSSGWVDGGHDQTWWCNSVANSFIQSRSIGPQHATERISSSEEDRRDWKGHVTYKYHCTVRIRWEPIYVERRDARCGIEK